MVDINASAMSPPLSELNPVQRSSSLRVSRQCSPEKCESLRRKLERRRTCIPFIGSPPDANGDSDVRLTVRVDGEEEDLSSDDAQSGVYVIRIGSDDIEFEEGKVKRTMRGMC